MTDEYWKQLIDLMIEALDAFVDREFQERVWGAGIGPEISSFDEAICQLFDDTGLTELLEEPNETVVNSLVDAKIRKFDKIQKKIDSHRPYYEFRDSPIFLELLELAKETQTLLQEVKKGWQ